MTDYCYRNYKNYLKNAIIHESYDETMSTLQRIQEIRIIVFHHDNFVVKNR